MEEKTVSYKLKRYLNYHLTMENKL